MTPSRAGKAMTDEDMATVRKLAEPIIPPGPISLNTVELVDTYARAFTRSQWFPAVVAELDRLREANASLESLCSSCIARGGELLAENEKLRSEVARLSKREGEWREAAVATEQVLAGWASSTNGQIWRHPTEGDQDPWGTNRALATIRALLREDI